MTRVIVVGAGYGGLDTAIRLKKANKKLDIILIDKNPLFVYQTSLHNYSVGKVRKSKITLKLKKLGIKYYQDELVEVLPEEKSLHTLSRKLNYDYLVLSVGAVTNYCRIPGMEENSLPLKKISDAKKIRKTLLEEMEKAKHYKEPIQIAVCGAGTTGVEVAMEIQEFCKKKAEITLIDSFPTILASFNKQVITKAIDYLQHKGVKIKVNSPIKKADYGKLHFKDEDKYFSMIVWCGGIKPNPILKKTGLRLSENGAVMIADTLQSNYSNVYAIGDCSYNYKNPYPWTAQMAIEQAKIVSKNIINDINGAELERLIIKPTPYLISLGKKGILAKENGAYFGYLPVILKKLVEIHYMFTRRMKWL